ncbi:MAG: DNA-directed RNA polymerase subunit delta [Bacilli bacterium]|jgi:DNA-directed RNA polymerase subunit delta|nr:DNA-directed RNA polymerase subunit delta [Bacilli bacterium]
MLNTKSLLEVAYEEISKAKGPVSFKNLYETITKDLEMSDEEKKEHIGRFYTDISLDGHFVALPDGMWDLRANHTYEKVHIDVNDVYSDVETSDDDADDQADEKEYNAAVEGKAVSGDEAEESEEPKPEAINPEDLGIKND